MTLQQYLSFLPGRWLWSVRTPKPDSLIAKFKEAGGTVREIDVWASHRDVISALVICIIVCLSRAVNHYRDNAITYKAKSDKMPENWSWRTRQLLTCRCVGVLLRSFTVHEELADAKAENDALRDDVAAGRRRLHINSLSVSAWSHTASGVDNAASPTGRHRFERDYFTLRGWSLCKNNWKEPRSILMSSADRVAHIDGQLIPIIVSNTRASSGV